MLNVEVKENKPAYIVNLSDEFGFYKVTVTVTTGESREERNRKTTVSVWGLPSPEDFGQMERPAISAKGADKENDKLWRKYNRLEVENMRSIVSKVLPLSFSTLNIANYEIKGFDLEKLPYSRYAGCSCPCSPGFVLSTSYRSRWFSVDVEFTKRAK